MSLTFLESFNINHRRGLFLSFVLGFVVRLVPEVLSYPYPIGFDTVYYAARVESGVVWHHWTSVFSAWLLYGILIPVYQVVQVDPFLLLKLVAPALYALNVCGVYYFSSRALGWDVRKGLIAAFFFAFQLASLRLSWDLYRNMLGLAILLFALPMIQKIETKKWFALFVLLSIFVVFSHELASVVIFAAVFGVMAWDFLKGKRVKGFKVLVAIFPALAIFLTRVYLPLFISVNFDTERIIIRDSQPSPHPGGLFFFIYYLNPSDAIEYPTYLNLFSSVLSLFVVLYLLCLPLVFVGFFRDRILDGWALLVAVGSFSSLIMPFATLSAWSRWMFLLVYPFTFYAVNGVERVLGSRSGGVRPNLKWIHWMKVSKRTTHGILFLTVLFGLLLMTMKFGDNGVFSIPTTGAYLPSTMLQNTVPLQDVEGIVEVMEWLNGHITDGSCVLVHSTFLSWARLYLNNNQIIVAYSTDVEGALNVALSHNFNPVYLVWWGENIGWYRVTVPSYFRPVFESGRMTAFQYLD